MSNRILGPAASLLLAAALAAPASAQRPAPLALAGVGESREESGASALERGRYAVVIDLDRNRLYFKRGEDTLWDAPIGTGTGLLLRSDDRQWDFSTPNGTFHVKYKEENPTWVAPDWYFLENGLPVPPQDDESRIFPGGLGAAAVYLEHDLAIHGTDKPELLGQRVSHGCIRLENKYAQRLYHNVQIGTEVIIVGGEEVRRNAKVVDVSDGKVPSTFKPKDVRPAPKDPVVARWERLSTDALLEELDDQFRRGTDRSRWAEVAGLLMDRGMDRDDEALEGLLARAPRAFPGSRELDTEFATYLADAYSRAPTRTLEILSTLDREERRRAAGAIVGAALHLYHGDFSDPAAPWPTRRLPATLVTDETQRGWSALSDAEEAHRRSQAGRRADD